MQLFRLENYINDCELQSKESLHIDSELSLKELSYPTDRKVSYQE